MKYRPILIFFIFFQNFSFSQITSNYIDIKIEQRYYKNQNPPEGSYELKFNNKGLLLKRTGYKIQMRSNSIPTDLVETYTYSDEGLPTIILEQEKNIDNKITPRFHSKYFYNEKNQLIEMLNFNYILDSIQQKITFEYDGNGNRIKINKSNSEYILTQFDPNNKYIKSQLFINNSYVKDLQITNDPIFLYRDLSDLKTNKNMDRVYFAPISLSNESKTNDKIEFDYYKNGLIKTKKIITSFSDDDTFKLANIYTIKCDGKTKYDKSIIERINKQILQIEMWQ